MEHKEIISYGQAEMIDMFYQTYDKKMPTKSSGLVRPEIVLLNRKTFINNFIKICDKFKRPAETIRTFIKQEINIATKEEEMTYDVTISGTGTLLIDGIHQKPKIEKLFKKFADIYVTCSSCKSNDTTIEKKNRINFMMCPNCNSSKPLII